MDIEHRFDDGRKCVLMTIGEAASGAAVSRYIAGLAAERPELADWDWIQDIRDSRGKVDNADIAVVAEALATASPGPCWTIYVTHDHNLALWCKVMDAMFSGRLHRVVATPQAAATLLDTLRGAGSRTDK
ncbi:MAG: hypothetical protein ACK4JY_00490 [Brevundimonas sp.]|uniref:hypothetical protein n=1 Tax=Brevundimonas sp. TaxID=1871086 RepID=UPI00391DFDD1